MPGGAVLATGGRYPSSWPELVPTEEDQDRERQRLFALIEELVKWENSNSERVIGEARREIARSLARNRKADGEADERDLAVLLDEPAQVFAMSSKGFVNKAKSG